MTKQLSPAQAKRILQDWIEDDGHAASLVHWPDLNEAYQALRAIAESADEPSSPPAVHRVHRASCSEHGLQKQEGCKVCDVIHGPMAMLVEDEAKAVAWRFKDGLDNWIVSPGRPPDFIPSEPLYCAPPSTEPSSNATPGAAITGESSVRAPAEDSRPRELQPPVNSDVRSGTFPCGCGWFGTGGPPEKCAIHQRSHK